eukprot:6187619-Pleurochrysis_carterae.AAC.1
MERSCGVPSSSTSICGDAHATSTSSEALAVKAATDLSTTFRSSASSPDALQNPSSSAYELTRSHLAQPAFGICSTSGSRQKRSTKLSCASDSPSHRTATGSRTPCGEIRELISASDTFKAPQPRLTTESHAGATSEASAVKLASASGTASVEARPVLVAAEVVLESASRLLKSAAQPSHTHRGGFLSSARTNQPHARFPANRAVPLTCQARHAVRYVLSVTQCASADGKLASATVNITTIHARCKDTAADGPARKPCN